MACVTSCDVHVRVPRPDVGGAPQKRQGRSVLLGAGLASEGGFLLSRLDLIGMILDSSFLAVDELLIAFVKRHRFMLQSQGLFFA